jgi:hypothetical protein
MSKKSSSFYQALTSRNRHFVTPKAQAGLRKIKVLIAGCGAAGGACIEPLVRLGVTHLRLTDNGEYELTNLNRQHAFVDSIGQNKSTFHANEALRINPYADIVAYPEGVTPKNITALVKWADLVIDAVDVTVQKSIQMKFRLHSVAHSFRKPVLSPLDPGFLQIGQIYDYRNPKIKTLNGKLEACQKTTNPIQGLLTMFPPSTMPPHSLQLVLDLLQKPGMPASQLGISADLLSSIAASLVLGFVSSGKLPRGWKIDMAKYAIAPQELRRLQRRAPSLRKKICRLAKVRS